MRCQHRRHQERRRHPVLFHQPQPLSGIEPVLDHVGVARIQVAEHTDGAADVKVRDAHHAHRRRLGRVERCGDARESRAELSVGDADRLGESGCAAGEKDEAVAVIDIFGGRRRGHGMTVQQVGRRKCFGRTRFQQPSRVGLPRNAHVGAFGVGEQTLDLLRGQGGVHQCCRAADPRRTEHGRDGQWAADIDDRDTPSGGPAG